MPRIRITNVEPMGLNYGDHRHMDNSLKFRADRGEGYTPLPKLFNGSDYFQAKYEKYHIRTLANAFSLRNGRQVFQFNKNMRSWRNNQQLLISIYMLSFFGIQGRMERVSSNLSFDEDGLDVILLNPIDIFTLALIKTDKINNLEWNNHIVDIDPSDLLILISQSKFKSPAFMQQYYNGTSRNYLRKMLKAYTEFHGIETKIVDDKEIAKYHYTTNSVQTSSITEMIRIDQEVKGEVFSNLKKSLVI